MKSGETLATSTVPHLVLREPPLSRDELRYILDPADVMGADDPSETFRVLKQNEERQYGEYRTRRLVLEAWDRLMAEESASHAAIATA